MDRITKERIIDLRTSGMHYVAISRLLGIPITTIKSFAYRYQEQFEATYETKRGKRCPHCGKPIPTTKYRPRRYCSDACRKGYWSTHRSEIHHPAFVDLICPVCRKTFQDYPNRQRKYCSNACYIAARFGGSAT